MRVEEIVLSYVGTLGFMNSPELVDDDDARHSNTYQVKMAVSFHIQKSPLEAFC